MTGLPKNCRECPLPQEKCDKWITNDGSKRAKDCPLERKAK